MKVHQYVADDYTNEATRLDGLATVKQDADMNKAHRFRTLANTLRTMASDPNTGRHRRRLAQTKREISAKS